MGGANLWQVRVIGTLFSPKGLLAGKVRNILKWKQRQLAFNIQERYPEHAIEKKNRKGKEVRHSKMAKLIQIN